MDRVRVTPLGTKEMQRRLGRMSGSVQGAVMSPIVAAGAKTVRDLAAALAPKKSGALGRGIIADLMKVGAGFCYYWVRLEPDVFYGRFHEFGLGSGGPGTSAKTRRRIANYEHSIQVQRELSKKSIGLAELKKYRFNRDLQNPWRLGRRELKRQYILAKGGYLQGQRRPNMPAHPFIRPAVKFTREPVRRMMLEGIFANVLRWTE